MTIQIIGLTGHAYSGKSTTARALGRYLNGEINKPEELVDEYLRRQLDDSQKIRTAVILPFAYALREEVALYCSTHKLPRDVIWHELHHPDLKEKWRHVMQFWGTEVRRDMSGHDYWIDKSAERINFWASRYRDARIMVIIDDVRFPNEADWVTRSWIGPMNAGIPHWQSRGLLFKLADNPDRELSGAHGQHSSERGVDAIITRDEIAWGPVEGRVEQIVATLTRTGAI